MSDSSLPGSRPDTSARARFHPYAGRRSQSRVSTLRHQTPPTTPLQGRSSSSHLPATATVISPISTAQPTNIKSSFDAAAQSDLVRSAAAGRSHVGHQGHLDVFVDILKFASKETSCGICHCPTMQPLNGVSCHHVFCIDCLREHFRVTLEGQIALKQMAETEDDRWDAFSAAPRSLPSLEHLCNAFSSMTWSQFGRNSMANFFQYGCPLCVNGTSTFSSTPTASLLIRDLSTKILEIADTHTALNREAWTTNPRPRCFRGLFLDALDIGTVSKIVYNTRSL